MNSGLPAFELDVYTKIAKDFSFGFELTHDIPDKYDNPRPLCRSTPMRHNLLNSSVFGFNMVDVDQFIDNMPIAQENQNNLSVLMDEEENKDQPQPAENGNPDMPVKREKYIRGKLLEGVCRALHQVFIGKTLTEEALKLDDYELKLFKAVLAKKFDRTECIDVKKDVKDIEGSELINYLKGLNDNFGPRKRREEKIKFVFKNTLKALRRRFADKNNLPFIINKEVAFFHHYFGDVIESKKLTVEVFFDPLNSSNNPNPSFKTLSKKYLCLLFSSTHFKADFANYIKESFISDYNEKISKKFNKMFKKTRRKMRTSGKNYFNALIDDFATKMAQNKRFKMPWTSKEVEKAIEEFQRLMEELESS